MYYISSHDFGAIQTTRVDIYTFTTETPYKISSRTHLPPSLRTGKFTVECPCPEAFRAVNISPKTGLQNYLNLSLNGLSREIQEHQNAMELVTSLKA
jgi:hypothetical protein